jgi:hypothetical protein
VIGGKRVCLKAGQRCDRRKDRQSGLIVAAHHLRYPADYVGFVFLDADRPCQSQCSFDVPEPGVFDVASVDYGDRPVVVVTTPFLQPPARYRAAVDQQHPGRLSARRP